MLFHKSLHRSLVVIETSHAQENQAFERQQAGAIRRLTLSLFDAIQTGCVLLSFPHSHDFLQVGQDVFAAKLDAFVVAARAKRIGVDGHFSILLEGQRSTKASILAHRHLADEPRGTVEHKKFILDFVEKGSHGKFLGTYRFFRFRLAFSFSHALVGSYGRLDPVQISVPVLKCSETSQLPNL